MDNHTSEQFYMEMFYALSDHRYWLAQVLEKPRFKTDNGTVEICCSQEFVDNLTKVVDKCEKAIEKARVNP